MLLLGVLMVGAPFRSVDSLQIKGPEGKFVVRVTYPTSAGLHPVIVWSHGLGGSKDGYQPLATYWAEHGYIVIQPTHADSLQNRAGQGNLRQALSREGMISATKNWDQRPGQISAVLDALPVLDQKIPDLKGQVDLRRVAVGGHSFGAHTAQLVAGTQLSGFMARNRTFEDKRPVAFIWISPQGPGPMLRESAWSGIRRPVLMISGDNDSNPITGQPSSWRKEVWDGLAKGDKYLLWVKDAYHGFGGISGRIPFPGSGPQDDGQVQDVQVTTLTFLDAYVKRDAASKSKLDRGALSFAAPAKLVAK